MNWGWVKPPNPRQFQPWPYGENCIILTWTERIEYKLLSLTYKVLTTSQPDYLHSLISVQATGRTHSSSRHPCSTIRIFLITNHQPPFTYASPYLWNQLPCSFRQPHSVHCNPGSPRPAHVASSQSPPSLSSPITASTFHSRLNSSLSQILSFIVTLITSGLTS